MGGGSSGGVTQTGDRLRIERQTGDQGLSVISFCKYIDKLDGQTGHGRGGSGGGKGKGEVVGCFDFPKFC